ncbi:hypothetical protein Cgig2_003722 [Carnegiea gigantea]|uniref:PAP/OAS1 substrate-binding-related domain-containing protein n=1 Tax=Carnegiea gigantea TaxID=171969 RepID=A0A9Q1QHF3_9CARY|nr:hypothetical protein Cgig2_003722 [Carnegiea gigantea]
MVNSSTVFSPPDTGALPCLLCRKEVGVIELFARHNEVKVVKCTVKLEPQYSSFLHFDLGTCQVDQFIGKDHLFKRSVILIKAWCYYESRLLGGYHGLISTYALETLVLHVINNFHCSLHCPLANTGFSGCFQVLYKFLEYYSTFDWERYSVAINGRVSISSLPDIAVQRPHDSDELLLTDEFLRTFREAFLSSTGACGTKAPAFPVKFLNIFDPLRDDNNLGRSVSKGNFYRIRSALSYGTEKLHEVLMLPPEKIAKGLENFFVNTLERNGRGRRADLLVPVPAYGTGGSEISSSIVDSDELLTGIQYDMWLNGYGIISPIQLNPLATPQVWSNEWVEMGQNMPFDQSIYYDVDGSPPSSVDSPRSLQLTIAVSEEEKGKPRGTGLYIPHLVICFFPSELLLPAHTSLAFRFCHATGGLCHLESKTLVFRIYEYMFEVSEWEHLIHCHEGVGGGGKEEEAAKKEQSDEAKTVDSQVCTPKGELFSDKCSSSCMVDFSLEEFPILPGSKPIPIKVSQSDSPKEEVNDAFASESSLGLGSFKCLSPRSVALLELGKQSDSDVSAILDLLDEPATVEVDKQEKSKEKPVVMMQPLQLKDEKEFPPLSSLRPAPARPGIKYSKKEFPPLGTVVKVEKKGQRKKNFKEACRI